jgi:uncharacterized protein (DUF2141 family)
VTIELGTLLALISSVVAAAVGYGKLQNQISGLKEERDQMWKEVEKLRRWEQDHERESSNVRLQIERDQGAIRQTISQKDGKLDEVIRRLGVIDSKLDKIETREEKS